MYLHARTRRGVESSQLPGRSSSHGGFAGCIPWTPKRGAYRWRPGRISCLLPLDFRYDGC
jgi:hypothetical protein